MNAKKVRAAMVEANRFLEKGKIVLAEDEKRKEVEFGGSVFYGSKETSALRRQSMELTRALSELRKSD